MKRNHLSTIHKEKRLELANKRLLPDGSIKDRIFVDEKKFQSSNNCKTEYVSRLSNEAFDKDKLQNIQTSSIRSNADINLLCYIGPFGKGKKKRRIRKIINIFELFFKRRNLAENMKIYNEDGTLKNVTKEQKKIHSGFDGVSYMNVLERKMIPSIKERYSGPMSNLLFIQDNASIHNTIIPEKETDETEDFELDENQSEKGKERSVRTILNAEGIG